MSRIITHQEIRDERGVLKSPFTLALVMDLHNAAFDDVMPYLLNADAVIIGGDLVNRHHSNAREAIRFLNTVPLQVPTYYAIGNHERRYRKQNEYWPNVMKSKVNLLDNTATLIRKDIVLGAISSKLKKQDVQTNVISLLRSHPEYRILISHHPEYYDKYIKGHDIDLTLSGHAHGGQIQLFGHGLYAPGQGFLPYYTNGFYDHKHLLVSRGMTNSARAPRLWNPCELIILRLLPASSEKTNVND